MSGTLESNTQDLPTEDQDNQLPNDENGLKALIEELESSENPNDVPRLEEARTALQKLFDDDRRDWVDEIGGD